MDWAVGVRACWNKVQGLGSTRLSRQGVLKGLCWRVELGGLG